MHTVGVIEIGGTHVTAAVLEGAADPPALLCSRRLPLDADASAGALVAVFVEAAASAAADQAPGGWVVAIPGPFDYVRGVGRFAADKFAALAGVDLGAALARGLGVDRSVLGFVNDADAFGLGAWALDLAGRPRRAIGLTLGTGIGSSFVADGRVLDGGAGVPPGGEVWNLDWRGAPLEETVSRRAIIGSYAARTGRDVDVADICGRARHGETAALGVVERAFGSLGAAIAPFVDEFGAEAVVVGGSVSASWDVIGPPLRAGLLGRRPQLAGLAVVPVALPHDTPLVGAALAARAGSRALASSRPNRRVASSPAGVHPTASGRRTTLMQPSSFF